MKTTFCIITLLVLTASVSDAWSADEPIDRAKVAQLHQKVKSGEQLTPEEQAYYERGKAERQKGGKTRKKAPKQRRLRMRSPRREWFLSLT